MTSLSQIRPKDQQLVIDLVRKAGLDVSDWLNFKGGQAKAASNPKYCYEWAFVQREKIVLNLWFANMRHENGKITQQLNLRQRAGQKAKGSNEIIWKLRASKMDNAIQVAYRQQLPLRVVVLDGTRRTGTKASKVTKRLLDATPWAVVSYDNRTGACTLERGARPAFPKDIPDQEELFFEGFEGELKRRFVLHRKREGRMRDLKIADTLRKNNGSLVCEVPNCGFDFANVYGVLGENFAEVHHKVPLSDAASEGRKIVLEDLIVVCSNCHAMIHRHGECRATDSLIPQKR